jgi:non-heme chloroperoxidase
MSQELNSKLRELDCNGVRLTYLEQGKGEPVIFVHGGMIDYRSWHFQIAPFSERFHVIAYNRRYAYPNQREGDYSDDTIENNASDLLGFMTRLGVGAAHIVTVSTGSFIALYFAVRHPELVKSLVVMEPAIVSLVIRNPKSKLGLLWFLLKHPSSGAGFMKLRRLMAGAADAYEQGDSRKAARMFATAMEDLSRKGRPVGNQAFFDRLPSMIQESLMDNIKDTKRGMISIEEPIFTCEDAARITAPILLIRSSAVTRPIIDRLSECVPKAEVVTIKHPGDQGRWLEPYPFNTVVLDFLAKHS